MIIMLLVITQFEKVLSISLHQTEGEFYEYYLENMISESQIMYKMHPQIQNVQVLNQCEEIYQIQGNKFISMSSNSTHFGTLSNNNEVIIYEWKSQGIQQVGQFKPIESQYDSFNIDVSQSFSILVDCYYNNELFLIQLIDGQTINAPQIQSSVPNSTKIQSCFYSICLIF